MQEGPQRGEYKPVPSLQISSRCVFLMALLPVAASAPRTSTLRSPVDVATGGQLIKSSTLFGLPERTNDAQRCCTSDVRVFCAAE